MLSRITHQIASLIEAGIQAAQAAGDLPPFDIPEIVVERSRHAAHGDYASPVCL